MNGAYGQYLDGTSTDISYSRVNAYELEELMNHAQQVVTPTLLYLFHEIEKRLDGKPTLIILDEAWLALSTPLFAAKLKEWLKVLRKANAAVVLATQRPRRRAQLGHSERCTRLRVRQNPAAERRRSL